jgi:hypothetical protein
MALTATQKVTVAEITREELATIESLASNLTTEQNTAIVADIAIWATIRDSHVRIKGGSDGLDFDNARKRDAIRERVRKALGLPLYSAEVSGGSWVVDVRGVF